MDFSLDNNLNLKFRLYIATEPNPIKLFKLMFKLDTSSKLLQF
jgi:hypothetical protein